MICCSLVKRESDWWICCGYVAERSHMPSSAWDFTDLFPDPPWARRSFPSRRYVSRMISSHAEALIEEFLPIWYVTNLGGSWCTASLMFHWYVSTWLITSSWTCWPGACLILYMTELSGSWWAIFPPLSGHRYVFRNKFASYPLPDKIAMA